MGRRRGRVEGRQQTVDRGLHSRSVASIPSAIYKLFTLCRLPSRESATTGYGENPVMPQLTWYFDFVSPFSYLQTQRFRDLPHGAGITFVPILFAGLLNHWKSKGPAEVPPKRVFTYRYVHWYAQHHGIAFRMPPAHPFNPLKALRLCIAAGATAESVRQIFHFIWAEGGDIEDDPALNALAEGLGVDRAGARIEAPEVKQVLRRNTERAAERGVFGVPTFEADGNLFWGVDSTDMLIDYLARNPIFDSPEMRRLGSLPEGVRRKQVTPKR
jgi:2-hydroxychromene-2-carboxylate isomerase